MEIDKGEKKLILLVVRAEQLEGIEKMKRNKTKGEVFPGVRTCAGHYAEVPMFPAGVNVPSHCTFPRQPNTFLSAPVVN